MRLEQWRTNEIEKAGLETTESASWTQAAVRAAHLRRRRRRSDHQAAGGAELVTMQIDKFTKPSTSSRGKTMFTLARERKKRPN